MADDAIYRPISETLLSDHWGRLTKYEFDLKRRDGDWQRQVRESYDRGNGATCLLHDPETDCVLLTRQFRLPAYLTGGEPALIETPAGLLEGAAPEERMREELIEETGYRIEALTHVFDVYMSPGSVTEILSHYIGTYSGADKIGAGGGKIDEGEDIEVLNVPFDEALEMVENGAIRDAKTVLLLQHLAIRRLRETQGVAKEA